MADHRPADQEYYAQQRTELFSQGDLFRDVPLGYPTVLHEAEEDEGEADERVGDWLSGGKRRFLSGPLDFGTAMPDHADVRNEPGSRGVRAPGPNARRRACPRRRRSPRLSQR